MSIPRLAADDTAVTPVIAIILMIAIAVVLAAVVGGFSLGLADDVDDNPPQTSFTFEYSDTDPDTLEIRHAAGSEAGGTQLTVNIRDATGDDDGTYNWRADLGGGTDVGAGDSITISASNVGGDGDLNLNGATVKIFWRSANGDSAHRLATWTGPAA